MVVLWVHPTPRTSHNLPNICYPLYTFYYYLRYRLYLFVNMIEMSPEMCYWKKINLFAYYCLLLQLPEFYCGWKMLVVVDLVAYLASTYGKRGGVWLTTQTLVGDEKRILYVRYGMVYYGLTSHSTQYRSFRGRGPWAVMCTSHSVMEGQSQIMSPSENF